MPSYSYSITPTAYSLPILHAAAQPSSTVIGVLLSSSSPQDSKQVVDDAVPILHHYTSLSPMMEAGLSIVGKYAEINRKGIVGVYVARDEGNGLPRAVERVWKILRESFEGAFALAIDNGKLAAGQPAYIPYLPTEASPYLLHAVPTTSPALLPEPFSVSSQSLPASLLKVIREKKIHRELRDFDDHLEDSSNDWLENSTIKHELQMFI
ncbi:hypothetical protein C351_04510 [Cryptococcus neoformans c8]|nr:hypothetical protein C353_04628 [Cryptococcus neoformans var. grubii AD1-83a]OXG55331.1 hypothetical protein C354_04562 [Cryptococcus neoformans var. grubii MW-RSA1955]OXG58567.1 hypothetical protein C352_04546 [Cryptococcus neoformans var. grubii CHC193]OXG60978.1 hypothetical protein C351_04510 [Cryptococcus neoformans var. grubii c8]OXH07150.1 hypothetical protein C369_04604 [Cryptococcus neoformans var. grubii A5-35-17]OXH08724.1 hypothetical protein C370_04679 [Cryptococcus neoformans 